VAVTSAEIVYVAVDEQGRKVEWTVQMASMLTLTRRGWTAQSLAVGKDHQVIEPVLGTLSRRAFYEKADPPAITLDLLEEAPPVAVPFDFARFVIRVLIENSWRHRGEHPLRLELVGTVSGKKYCLEVRDWGPGIAEEDIKQLFRPGHPSNGSRKEAREGSGMGLYLARSVLRFHGGTIKLRQPANPTTFEVCFPLASKRRGRPTEAPETEAS